MKSLRSSACLLALATFFVQPAAHAGLVTHGGFESLEGNSENSIPFGNGDPSFPYVMQRYQQIYNASGFGGANGAIKSIAFRLDSQDSFDSGLNNSFSVTLDLLVRLSHTTTAADSISSSSLDSHLGGDVTIVFDGVTTLNATQLPGTALNPFDFFLDVNDTFFYNGSENLLLDIQIRNAASIAAQVPFGHYFDAHGSPVPPTPAPFGRAYSYGLGPNTNLYGFSYNYGLVTQFDLQLTPVPGPLPLLSFFSALATMIVVRRRNVAC